jgi:hypothetical protein
LKVGEKPIVEVVGNQQIEGYSVSLCGVAKFGETAWVKP